jgi:hypothetical protein
MQLTTLQPLPRVFTEGFAHSLREEAPEGLLTLFAHLASLASLETNGKAYGEAGPPERKLGLYKFACFAIN